MSRAERRSKAEKRREEIKSKLICIIGDHLPDKTAEASQEALESGFSAGLHAADAWVEEEAKKNPQERSLLRDGVNLAMRFLRRNLGVQKAG